MTGDTWCRLCVNVDSNWLDGCKVVRLGGELPSPQGVVDRMRSDSWFVGNRRGTDTDFTSLIHWKMLFEGVPSRLELVKLIFLLPLFCRYLNPQIKFNLIINVQKAPPTDTEFKLRRRRRGTSSRQSLTLGSVSLSKFNRRYDRKCSSRWQF